MPNMITLGNDIVPAEQVLLFNTVHSSLTEALSTNQKIVWYFTHGSDGDPVTKVYSSVASIDGSEHVYANDSDFDNLSYSLNDYVQNGNMYVNTSKLFEVHKDYLTFLLSDTTDTENHIVSLNVNHQFNDGALVSNDIIGWPLKHKSKVVRDAFSVTDAVDGRLRAAEVTFERSINALTDDVDAKATTYVSNTEPTGGSVGDLWFNPANGELSIYTPDSGFGAGSGILTSVG